MPQLGVEARGFGVEDDLPHLESAFGVGDEHQSHRADSTPSTIAAMQQWSPRPCRESRAWQAIGPRALRRAPCDNEIQRRYFWMVD
jgi:hypothetical protein